MPKVINILGEKPDQTQPPLKHFFTYDSFAQNCSFYTKVSLQAEKGMLHGVTPLFND